MAELNNVVGAAPRSRLRGDAYEALRMLPKPIRRALHEAVLNWCPLWITREFQIAITRLGRERAVSWTCCILRDADAAETAAFARRYWPKRHGDYPALAAKATVQTYEQHKCPR